MNNSDRIEGVLTFDRNDFQVTRVALFLSALGVAAITVGRPIWEWIAGNPMSGTVSVDPEAVGKPPYETLEGATARWTGDLVVELASPSTGDRLAGLLPGVVLSVVVGLLAWLLIRLLTAIQAGNPLGRRSVWTLRGIAGTLLGAMMLLPISDAVLQATLATSGLARSADPVFWMAPLPLLLLGTTALVVAAIAEAFARVARLEDDVEGLV